MRPHGSAQRGHGQGLVASPFHSELVEARQKDPEELSKAQKRLNGKVKTYTYCPNATSTDPVASQETAMMFCFVHIAVHNPEGKYVGFKILMLIFDKGFSLDMLVKKVMDENADDQALGQINGMAEKDRTSKLQQQNKLQRTHLTDDNLEATAATQYKRICGNQDYLKFLESVGGQTEGQHGPAVLREHRQGHAPGLRHPPLREVPERRVRRAAPHRAHDLAQHEAASEPSSDDSRASTCSRPGTLDARGKPIELHECFMDPRLWFD